MLEEATRGRRKSTSRPQEQAEGKRRLEEAAEEEKGKGR